MSFWYVLATSSFSLSFTPLSFPLFFFFFSSRRRHTRSLRDWSRRVLFRSQDQQPRIHAWTEDEERHGPERHGVSFHHFTRKQAQCLIDSLRALDVGLERVEEERIEQDAQIGRAHV